MTSPPTRRPRRPRGPQDDACAADRGAVDNSEEPNIIRSSLETKDEVAGHQPETGADNSQSDAVHPVRGYSWPPFQPGHELSTRHGAYSPRRIGERAALISAEVLELAPHLAEPEFALALTEYAMARARVELTSVAIEDHLATAPIAKLSPRLIEAATAASREAGSQRASLGLDPRSLAELRQISTLADLNVALLSRIAPEVPTAIAEALRALNLGDRSEEFTSAFVAALRRTEDGK